MKLIVTRLLIPCFILLNVSVGLRAESLTVATYNVENYTLADRMVEGVYRKAYPKPESEKTALRSVLCGLNADVIALQEMGGEAYVQELQRDLAHEGMNYPHAVVLNAADDDRRIAVLSRRPFVTVGRHTDLTFQYFDSTETVKRGLLEVTVATEAGDLTIFVMHLKSRFTDRQDDQQSADRREKEAIAVRDRVLRIFPKPEQAKFLILGDCNDSRSSRPVRALLERGKTKIAEWLPAADSRGETWTYEFRREDAYSRVDHILVSPALRSAVHGGGARIGDAPETMQAGDHRPLVAVLDLVKQ